MQSALKNGSMIYYPLYNVKQKVNYCRVWWTLTNKCFSTAPFLHQAQTVSYVFRFVFLFALLRIPFLVCAAVGDVKMCEFVWSVTV